MNKKKRLVLTRKKMETIVCSVGETEIVFTISDIRAKACRVSVDAEPEVKIRRGELIAALAQEKQEALQGG